MSHSVVSGNTATNDGGGIYIHTGAVNNCLLFDNSAVQDGGAIHGGSANNCTISGNSAGGLGGGIYSRSVANSIVWYNTDSSSINMGASSDSFACSPEATGTGSITNAALFVDASNGNYRLQWISRCVTSGGNGSVVGPNDLDGVTRIQYITVDMRAYEMMDSDSDGLSDAEEPVLNGGPDPQEDDSDDDGILDSDEVSNGLDPLSRNIGIDSDSDNLFDVDEVNTHGTDPRDDGLLDGDEVNIHCSNPFSTNTDRDAYEVAMVWIRIMSAQILL